MSYNKPLICAKHGVERVYRVAKGRPSGQALHCPECTRENNNRHNRGRTSEYHHANHIKRYGITTEEYNQMFVNQNGSCAICGKPETARNQFGTKKLAVDHDHTTGQVRGLLCSQCNQMIGRANDNPCVLEAAAQYLHDYSCEGYNGHKAS